MRFEFPPKRIVSIVPSQTELLSDLGLDDEVIGITKFCVHPSAWQKQKANVGGTKNLRIEDIEELKPDLIIGNKEENAKLQIERLQEQFPVWMSDVRTLEDATTMIREIGLITGTRLKAEHVTSEISDRFSDLRKGTGSVLYLIWKNPWMAAGKNTFIEAMLETIGLTNVIQQERYPNLTDSDIASFEADFIFLSSEPYRFRENNIQELQGLSKRSRVMVVDGEMFSWYGSRMRLAPSYFKSLTLNV